MCPAVSQLAQTAWNSSQRLRKTSNSLHLFFRS